MSCIKTLVIESEIRGHKVLDPVHLTALHYLCEALNEERYEDAPEIIQTAKEIGVREDLIHKVLYSVSGVLILGV